MILKYILYSLIRHCHTHISKRVTLLNKIKSIDCGILEQSDTAMTKMFLFVDNKVGAFSDILIFNSTTDSHIYQTN